MNWLHEVQNTDGWPVHIVRKKGREMTITVFLVDDHAVVRDGLRMVLEASSAISVLGDASNGRDGVAQIRKLRPDVAILDIAMPELNGLEAARQIRSACPEIAIVVLSMHATTEHIFRALQVGAEGYVLKESAGKEVVDAVCAVCNGQRYLSQKIANTVIDDYVGQRRKRNPSTPLDRLSPRELEVLQLVAEGKSSAAIADIVHLSPKTIETYRSRLMHKLGVSDLTGLIKFAIRHGLTPLD